MKIKNKRKKSLIKQKKKEEKEKNGWFIFGLASDHWQSLSTRDRIISLNNGIWGKNLI